MQSSYRVIKYSNVDEKGAKNIVTKDAAISVEKEKNMISGNVAAYESSITSEDEIKYKNMSTMILEEARRKSEATLLKANIEAKNIEDEAYKKGYDKGYDEGLNNGYNEGLHRGNIETEKVREEITVEAQVKANDIIFKAKEEYESYLFHKKEEIKNLILQISDSLFKEKINDAEMIEKAIFQVIETSKNTESFIIKANSKIYKDLKKNIAKYKNLLTFSVEIHLLEDNFLTDNKVIIEKNNGKTIIDFDKAYDNIIEVIKNIK